VTNLAPTIIPRSDQLNADSLLTGPITVKVTEVALSGAADQPVIIHYEGENGRPYKPCLSMRRVMIKVWGEDGKRFVGQQMTLFCDPRVRFGSDTVGGIRISHMTGIDREVAMPLTTTRGKKAIYTVKPLLPESAGQRRQTAAIDVGDRGDDGFPGDRQQSQSSGANETTLGGSTFTFEDSAEFVSALPGYLERLEKAADLGALWAQFQPDLKRLQKDNAKGFAEAVQLKNRRKAELEKDASSK
jgi:hypothetical protein